MFYLTDALFVVPFLQVFVTTIRGGELGLSVGRSVRIKDPNIKKCSFKATPPEAIGKDIQPCTILDIGRGSCEAFSADRLQVWFD